MPASPDLPLAHAYTQYVRIPVIDWPLVAQGHKTELRAAGRYAAPAHKLRAPAPIVAYARHRFRADMETALLVLEAVWTEPLGAIDDESLRREGFASRQEFRRYWRRRHRAGYKPLSKVNVYQFRPWRDGDRELYADRLLAHLYGPWLDAA